eukprot:jgi/Hompol1/2611/HPOL_006076-RA
MIHRIHIGNALLGLDAIVFDTATSSIISSKNRTIVDLHRDFKVHNRQMQKYLVIQNQMSIDNANVNAPLAILDELSNQSFSAADLLALPTAQSDRRSSVGSNSSLKGEPDFSHDRQHLYMSFKACVAQICESGETAELFFSLFDSTLGKPVSEEFIIRLNSHGVPIGDASDTWHQNGSQQDPSTADMAALFMDLSVRDTQCNLLLICRIIQVTACTPQQNTPPSIKPFGQSGPTTRGDSGFERAISGVAAAMGVRSRISARSSSNNNGNGTAAARNSVDSLQTIIGHDRIRKLFGVAFIDISDVFAQNQQNFTAQPVERSVQILTASNAMQDIDGFSMDSITDPQLFQPMSHGETITIALSAFDMISEGSFASVRITNGRAVQVSVQVRHSNGLVIPGAILSGVGEQPVDSFDSVVFANASSPKWSETIRIDLEPEEFRQAHLLFTLRMCTPSIGEMASERFAFGFLPLTRDQNAIINDSTHRLTLYKYDKRVVAPLAYLNYPAGPNIFVPAQQSLASPSTADSLSTAADAIAKLPSLKDTLSIRTSLFSTIMTQETSLLFLLNWKHSLISGRNTISKILTDFVTIGDDEVHKFLPSILAELLDMLDASVEPQAAFFPMGNIDGIQNEIFEALIFVLTIALDKRSPSKHLA